MIYVEENPREAKSFTDETSAKKAAASDRKVSIHGQVIKELPLSWFYDLMRLYPGESGEVKSNRILNDFHNLPSDKRDKIWAGMKQVIINIVDSLSYQFDYKKILSDVYKHDRAYDLLKLHAGRGDVLAKEVLKMMDESVTEWIIRDSPPHRLRDMMRPKYFPGSLAYYMHEEEWHDDEVDLTPFRAKRSSMTGKAVKYAAKSGSVFNAAIDIVGPRQMFHHDGWKQFQVRRALQDSHAFDRGDDKSIEWIDRQRREIGRGGVYDYYDYSGSWVESDAWEVSESYERFGYGKLYSMGSESSSYIQAADIAAGFARQDYERHGVAAVAGRFDYVTLNGERITQNNAERKFEVWRQLIEQEKKNSQRQVIRLN